MTPAPAQALLYTRTWGFTPFGRGLLVNAIVEIIARAVWGTFAAIWRLPHTIVLMPVSLFAIVWAADRINASTEGRAGFWATASGLATGRVPR